MTDLWNRADYKLPTDTEHDKCNGKYLVSDGFKFVINSYNKELKKFGIEITYKGQKDFVTNESAVYWQMLLLPER